MKNFENVLRRFFTFSQDMRKSKAFVGFFFCWYIHWVRPGNIFNFQGWNIHQISEICGIYVFLAFTTLKSCWGFQTQTKILVIAQQLKFSAGNLKYQRELRTHPNVVMLRALSTRGLNKYTKCDSNSLVGIQTEQMFFMYTWNVDRRRTSDVITQERLFSIKQSIKYLHTSRLFQKLFL